MRGAVRGLRAARALAAEGQAGGIAATPSGAAGRLFAADDDVQGRAETIQSTTKGFVDRTSRTVKTTPKDVKGLLAAQGADGKDGGELLAGGA